MVSRWMSVCQDIMLAVLLFLEKVSHNILGESSAWQTVHMKCQYRRKYFKMLSAAVAL